jgi:DNA-directed RNA polymerase specialized sigma24 family protein
MRAALELAIPLDALDDAEVQVVDRRAELERTVLLRDELAQVERLAGLLTFDQRLVLAAQVAGIDRDALCERYGWSAEKYRKVAQRARARLSRLMGGGDLDSRDVPLSPAASEGKSGTTYDETNTNS